MNQNEQKMLEKEIEVLKKAQSSPHVVKFFGAWFQEVGKQISIFYLTSMLPGQFLQSIHSID